MAAGALTEVLGGPDRHNIVDEVHAIATAPVFDGLVCLRDVPM
jgi:hypothetical protein